MKGLELLLKMVESRSILNEVTFSNIDQVFQDEHEN
jgi:hypothetical protein